MSLNDEERRIMVEHESRKAMRDKSDYNCSFDATEQLVQPLIEPTRRLIEIVLGQIE
jgi:hypothetical protein